MRISSYIIELLVGYTIGSLPMAYFLVKWKLNLDIRHEGSSNVGAMNAFEVTNSKVIGIACMISDLLKGVFAVLAGMLLFAADSGIAIALCGIGAVIGHNYPVWLKFKGGRGLSTTAGIMLIVCWAFVIIWIVLWAVLYKLFKDIHIANMFASILGPISLACIPVFVVNALRLPIVSYETVIYLASTVCVLILLRHAEIMNAKLRSYFQSTK